MPESCTYFKVTQGPEHSSTKEYYTTYFSKITVFCVDCDEVIAEEWQDSGRERQWVDVEVVKQHRKPLVTVEWIKE